MPFFRIFFGLLLIFLAQVAFAQLPNEVFYIKEDKVYKYEAVKPENLSPKPTDTLNGAPKYIVRGLYCPIDPPLPIIKERSFPEHNIELGIHTLGFFKDNEYFNKIADGYTLFGYQFQPSLKYYPSEKIKIEAGVLLLKDFGNNKYKLIQPTFTATYSTGKHTVLFGTLNGNLNFGYIEPLWDFERQLTKPIQNGIQYKYAGGSLNFQTWVDWQVMQYAYDTKQEEIAGGLLSNILLLNHSKTGKDSKKIKPTYENNYYSKHNDYISNITLPIQFTAKHKGGQIDVNDTPLSTLFNGAIGLEGTLIIYKMEYPDSNRKQFLNSFYTKNYLVGYKDHSFTHQLPFQGGSGIYLNAGADTRWANFMLSYWKGNGYISEFGGKLYQSASTTVHNPDYTEKKRQLLIFRIMKDWNVGDGLTFTGRLEPFYDFTSKSTEFSAGLYLNFNTDFYLAKIKRNGSE